MLLMQKSRWVSLAGLLAVASMGCKKADEHSVAGAITSSGGAKATLNQRGFPQVGAINLGLLQSGGAHLASGSTECEDLDYGLLNLAFGSACSTSRLHTEFLLGAERGDRNHDGVVDCNDYDAAKAAEADGGDGPGLMMHLICGVPEAAQSVESVTFETDGLTMAISFADTNPHSDYASVGAWRAGGESSYPAQIRIWTGSAVDTMVGYANLELQSLDNGWIQLARIPNSGDPNLENMQFDVRYSEPVAGAGGCSNTTTVESCMFQQTQVYVGEGAVTNGPPNKMNLRVFGDGWDNPGFVAIEGWFALTTGTATARGTDGHSFDSVILATRQMYVRAVKHADSDQVWGYFEFLDGTGELIQNEGWNSVLETLRSEAGFCMSEGSNGAPENCGAGYDGAELMASEVWIGKAAMELTVSNGKLVDPDFLLRKPSALGFCTLERGCSGL